MKVRLILLILVITIGNVLFSLDVLKKFDKNYIDLRNTRDGTLKMIEVAKGMLQSGRDDYTANWQLGVAYYYLGEYHETSIDKKKDLFFKAKESCEKALKINPNGIDALYWYGVSFGMWGAANGILESLFGANDVLKAMNRVIDLDPSYFMGLPWAVRAKIYYYVPSFLFGNKEQAYKDLKMALKYGPTLRFNYQYSAEILVDDRRYAEAREVIKVGLALPVDKSILMEEMVSIKILSNYLAIVEKNS